MGNNITYQIETWKPIVINEFHPYNTRPLLTTHIKDNIGEGKWFLSVSVAGTKKYDGNYYAWLTKVGNTVEILLNTAWIGYPLNDGNITILKINRK